MKKEKREVFLIYQVGTTTGIFSKQREDKFHSCTDIPVFKLFPTITHAVRSIGS